MHPFFIFCCCWDEHPIKNPTEKIAILIHFSIAEFAKFPDLFWSPKTPGLSELFRLNAGRQRQFGQGGLGTQVIMVISDISGLFFHP